MSGRQQWQHLGSIPSSDLCVCVCVCSEMDDQVEAQLDPEVQTDKTPSSVRSSRDVTYAR